MKNLQTYISYTVSAVEMAELLMWNNSNIKHIAEFHIAKHKKVHRILRERLASSNERMQNLKKKKKTARSWCSCGNARKPKYEFTQKLQDRCSTDIGKENFAQRPFLSLLPSQSTLSCTGTSHQTCAIFWRQQPQLPALSDSLFVDEAQFAVDGFTNKRNLHSWAQKNQHLVTQYHLQQRFSVNILSGVSSNNLIVRHVIEWLLTAPFYRSSLECVLPLCLVDVPLETRGRMWLQNDGTPPHSAERQRRFWKNIVKEEG